ncbi:phosphotransferase enzyme family protein [Marinilabilia salmonicolor]|uniref:Phosphotransferase family enzyme n=1 Tax=Marinilabilia salmonicolor TaxID=989 RepID=A0A2T0XEH0_9BACT|nr:aminoglycoside phosphotransferase family protein [Marinilabilia salmonicolor]PRY97348.1 phosphotransferase family enzyme [Marinilabilia salmonicolor]RCW36831.1 phosphotransferase family enzyme [Marinilabilia salmonicolor]
MTPEQISNQFSIDGTVATIKPFGNGLINTTYKVRTSENDSPNYLLQIVNHHIFKNVPELTRNIERVTSHIREKLEAQGAHDIDRRVLTPVKTNNGEGFYKDDGGNYWRMFLFIEGAHSYDQLTNIKQAEAGGRAFGQFQKLVSDLPGEPLYPVIPGFHDTEMRIKNFNERVNENPVGRLEEVQQDVNFLLERSDEYKKIIQMGREGKIPQRIVHQDTKFNNVLLDENDEVLCVIDLDTVMPGYVCYDIGDAIRNGANTGKEDDPNLDNVGINMELFEGFIKGFLQETNGILTREEKETLAFGAKLLTYEQAVRFMDDFLDGDKYYKTDSVKHNLIRARAQIKLLKSMEENFDRMEEIVSRYV